MKKHLFIFLLLSFTVTTLFSAENKTVIVAVNPILINTIHREVKTYISDITREGWHVELKTPHHSNFKDFEDDIVNWKKNHNMKGVVLIGSFPYTKDPSKAHINPAFSSITGNKIDFWVSRIDVELLSSFGLIDPPFKDIKASLLKNYFKKNHAFRNSSDYSKKVKTITDNTIFQTVTNYWAYIFSLGENEIESVHDTQSFFEKAHNDSAITTQLIFHGNKKSISISKTDFIHSLSFILDFESKSKFINLFSCFGGVPYKGNTATSILFSKNSRVLAVMAKPWSSEAIYWIDDYQFPYTEKTVGDVLIANTLFRSASYELMTYYGFTPGSNYIPVLLGDGTLSLEHPKDLE